MPLIAPKLDWLTNPVNPTSVDMNRIENNISFINSEIETKKGVIVDALNDVGIPTLLADTHAQIATKILAAEKIGVSISASAIDQPIPKGIYDTGGGVVVGGVGSLATFNIEGRQSGATQIPNGASSVTVNIPTTDRTRSILMVYFTGTGSFSSLGANQHFVAGYFNSPTQLVFHRGASHPSWAINITWEIIIFKKVKSLQYGVALASPITISNVNRDKCAIFYSRNGTSTSDNLNTASEKMWLSNNTTLEYVIGSIPNKVAWFVVEFD